MSEKMRTRGRQKVIEKGAGEKQQQESQVAVRGFLFNSHQEEKEREREKEGGYSESIT